MKRFFYGLSILLMGLMGCQSADTRPVPAGSESFATMTLIFDG
jgi:hypothetical protein